MKTLFNVLAALSFFGGLALFLTAGFNMVGLGAFLSGLVSFGIFGAVAAILEELQGIHGVLKSIAARGSGTPGAPPPLPAPAILRK